MKRPNVEQILEPLKPFQRATVEHAFHRLFQAADSTSRFLVADEVGLGKTLVARGIVARAVDELWDEVDRIDIVYICSNQSIARANLPKLQFMTNSEVSFSLATRLTLMATELAPGEDQRGLAGSKVNFVSFTPGTSFNMGNSGGQRDERRVLFHLLEELVEPRVGLMNFLQCTIRNRDRWRGLLNCYSLPIEKNIRKAFNRDFKANKVLRKSVKEIAASDFGRYREHYPESVRQRRNKLIGELRQMLAHVCVEALQPNLVILDEFQRFRHLLDDREDNDDPAAEIAQALFKVRTPEGHPVRTLLLSATPYKLYTSDAEIEQENHYQDFIATTAFLLGHDIEKVSSLQRDLAAFGRLLKQASAGSPINVLPVKQAVEKALKSVMARTERVAATAEGDAMLKENPSSLRVEPGDVRQYLASDALFQAVGERDPMSYWKSAPYLAHFMHSYKVSDRITESLEISPERVVEVLKAYPDDFLQQRELSQWRTLDPAHAKLRELVHDFLDSGLWKMLWMPPTVPYWPLEGAYEGQADRTKALLFSAWNMVPDVVSAVLSYEAERRMLGGTMDSYHQPDKQQSRLLALSEPAEGKRARHRLLLLLLPCLVLADEAHPLAAPEGVDRRTWVKQRVRDVLAHADLPDPSEGAVDNRWEWAAPLLLDPDMREFLEYWRDVDIEEMDKPNPDILPGYIQDMLNLDPATLGRRPDELEDLLTDMALGAPGVLAARTLRLRDITGFTRRALATQLAHAFWKLFNRPAVIRLLLQLAGKRSAGEEDGVYWHEVMRYCCAGNLQAVLDETWHLVTEQHGWVAGRSEEDVSANCIEQMVDMVEPRRSRVHAHCYEVKKGGRVHRDSFLIRTVFALRLGHLASDEGALTLDAVRGAFNSPFRPFVLASTSVGQEGLDFHPWCHRLVHWNLPGNPVDMEQREGRVHRYKGHAVRKNVAEHYAADALCAWSPGDDLWALMFDQANDAARREKRSDLVPYWLASGSHRIERHVPTLPYTTEVAAFRRLKRQLAAYRVVFGQPRQEELLDLLDRSEISAEELARWSIDLSP